MNEVQRAVYVIEHNAHMTIATSDAVGKPWASTVFFVHDDAYNLYWVSSKHARHSINIRQRREVGIVIFGDVPERGVDGVYFDAEAIELDDHAAIEQATAILHARPQPDKFTVKGVNDVTGTAAWRVYKAKPLEISKRADTVDGDSGQAVTVRTQVQLVPDTVPGIAPS